MKAYQSTQPPRPGPASLACSLPAAQAPRRSTSRRLRRDGDASAQVIPSTPFLPPSAAGVLRPSSSVVPPAHCEGCCQKNLLDQPGCREKRKDAKGCEVGELGPSLHQPGSESTKQEARTLLYTARHRFTPPDTVVAWRAASCSPADSTPARSRRCPLLRHPCHTRPVCTVGRPGPMGRLLRSPAWPRPPAADSE
jgi:hypothetical protein